MQRPVLITTSHVEAALDGDGGSIQALVAVIEPVIRARVKRALRRSRASPARLADLVQDVYVELFRERGRALRAWDPSRGSSLANWVGLIAQRHAAEALGGDARDVAGPAVALESLSEGEAPSAEGPENAVCAVDRMSFVIRLLRAELSPRGYALFQALVLEDEPIASVCSRTGMSTAAVQKWSSRIKRRIDAIVAVE